MLEVFEKLIKELEKIKEGKTTLLDLVKDCECSKEEWEDYKKEQFKEIEEVDKYFEELEKKTPKLTDDELEYILVNSRWAFKKGLADEVVIYKNKQANGKAYITIEVETEDEDNCILSYLFKQDEEFVGLEFNKFYKLKELGL